MTYTKRQIARILNVDGKPLLPANTFGGKQPPLVAETFIQRRLYDWEDRAVGVQYQVFRALYKRLNQHAASLATHYGVGKLEPTGAGVRWQRALVAAVSQDTPRMYDALAEQAFRSAMLAYHVGYYGRAWVVNEASAPEAPISVPTPDPERAAEQVTIPTLKEGGPREQQQWQMVYDLLGKQWQAEYGNQQTAVVSGIMRSLNASLAQGHSIPQAMRGVASVLGVTTDRRLTAYQGRVARMGTPGPRAGSYRANFNKVQTLTRSYIVEASNAGALELYRNNADVLQGVEWSASRVGACPECRALDGQQWAIDDMMIPRPVVDTHPNCILPGNEVGLPGKLVGATKSLYVGPAVEISFADGRKITVTPNHPILTPGGWVFAKLLNVGQHVLRAIDVERVVSAVNPDDKYRPAMIEEVFSAFVESSAVVPGRVKVSAEDFYGDGRFIDGDVEVVNVDGLLLDDIYPAFTEPAGKSALDRGGMQALGLAAESGLGEFFEGANAAPASLVGSFKHLGTLFGGSVLPADIHAVRYVSGLNPLFEKATTKYAPSYASIFGDGLLGLSGKVANNQGVNVRDINAPVSDFHTEGAKASPQNLVIDASLARQFGERFAGLITSDEIVQVRDFDFSGHVYDLQVEPYQLYTCNGVIVKNCRCALIPWVKDLYDLPALSRDSGPRETFWDFAGALGVLQLLSQFETGTAIAVGTESDWWWDEETDAEFWN